MKIKYVCRGLFRVYVNFHNNPIKWSTNSHVKIRRWEGGRKKSLIDSHVRFRQQKRISAFIK